jgi:SAM-dependent methyltransferase
VFLEKGLNVVAVDRDPQDIPGARFIQADIENGPWPLAGETFDGIVVTNYLHRPLFEVLKRSLKDNGVLIYETFMVGNERFGRPSNPAFLLRAGELLEAFAGLEVLGFEQGDVTSPKPATIQRLCAVRGQTV